MIVAINIPLALMFALTMLYVRGQSANLLSLGAVDFGIIVDSSVIMVEAIYRKLSSGEEEELSLPQRIIHAANAVERPLFYSTLIMVSGASLPLFMMTGAGGADFCSHGRNVRLLARRGVVAGTRRFADALPRFDG